MVVHLIFHDGKGTGHLVLEFVMSAPCDLPAFNCLEADCDLLEARYVTGGDVVGNDVLVLLKAS